MKECKYIVRIELCGYDKPCENKYSFSHRVKIDGKDVYGVCNTCGAF